ncbi:protein ecdysoneless homolog [Salvia splendens]|uniref:protein ecdysoneless homolog n=1 Tax=Salvia splendens TaxID=180675 RepID=UPI001C25C6DB|nr:protein ecdysoneless homolog [Salvia splendens]XP_042038893.1 protein ecdysoneless homolog [Salvia splendens]
MAAGTSSSSSIFSRKNSRPRPPDDTVFYSIYPDSCLSSSSAEDLHSLHLQILNYVQPLTAPYIWQHQPFSLSITPAPVPHLSGHLRFGDNLEDEWFVVHILFEISKKFPSLSIRVWDSDGEFLLIECAFHLPKWLNPETSTNRVFLRSGRLHILPPSSFRETPNLEDALRFLANQDGKDSSKSDPDAVQLHLNKKISEYPEHAYRNVHKVRVLVPVSVAWVLRHEPCLISLSVEGFYDRDIDSMKYAARMERLLPRGKQEEMVEVVVRMSKAMYAQLVQQKFQAPACYPMPERSNVAKYLEAELGMKIACGFEMMYQMRKKQGIEGKGSTWEAFRESLESSGYFKGLLPGSNEYKTLLEKAEGYYQNSSLYSRASEVLSEPVKRMDEILALPHSADGFKSLELPPSDDDSWLYGGEDELNAALQERQKEMDFFNSKQKKKHKSKEQEDQGLASGQDVDEYDLGGIAKSMQSFIEKMSSYKGAELPDDMNLEDVDLDVDQFMKDMESVMGLRGSDKNDSDIDLEEGSSSDLDFDDYEEGSEHADDTDEDGENEFIHSYSDALNKELKATTLDKTFVHANEESSKKKDEGTSNVDDEMEELTPVDVDFNLVKNFLESYSSQEGLSGPASNLLGLMGLRLPDDVGKGK